MQKWIVGVDLRHRSDGAARFAGWLQRHLSQPQEFVGIHVAPTRALDELERLEGRARVRERLQVEAELALERSEVRQTFAEVAVIEADDPADGLVRERANRSANGLVVGRKAASDGRDLVRLGSVARRLLQGLVAPTFVVPPDLTGERLGDGPVVIAVTPADASVGAVQLGTRLAAVLGRTVQFVRVVNLPEEYAQLYWAGGALEQFRGQQVDAAELRMVAWLAEQGHPARPQVRYGDEVGEILAAAAAVRAPLIVCGSRLLSRLERLVALSVSSELAAQSPVPVLVVPPDARG
jgi:nucleotide-binding universal stress UspA family protein